SPLCGIVVVVVFFISQPSSAWRFICFLIFRLKVLQLLSTAVVLYWVPCQ
uniref:Uncharacterized protein n=1 Tax=Aegilops tauschii subsp. strangulata TaxID=200361 RepID=A0A453S215_AEGTS